ncbi:MAG: hypothetical protein ACPG7W_11160, partial [Paracoccaceae bacterium]
MTAQPCKITFHIGVHKTATSHLQRSLLRASDSLAAHGVRYYGPDHLRLPGRSLPTLFGFRTDRAAPKRPPEEQVALLRKDGRKIVFSEENFISWPHNP